MRGKDAVPSLCLSPRQVTVSQDGRRARSRRGERRLETAARGRGERHLGMIESLPPLRRTEINPLGIFLAKHSPSWWLTIWRGGRGDTRSVQLGAVPIEDTAVRYIEDLILNKVQLDFGFPNNWEDIYIYLSFIFIFLPCIERIRSVFVQLMTR